MSVSKRILKSLRQFAKDLKKGDLTGYRVSKLIRNEDGTIKRVVTDRPRVAK